MNSRSSSAPVERNRLRPASGRQHLNGVGALNAALIDHAGERAARQPRLRIGALRVTPQPKQIFRQAAGQIAAAAAERNGLARRWQQRHRADGTFGQNPGVLAAPALLQRDDERVIRLRDARESPPFITV